MGLVRLLFALPYLLIGLLVLPRPPLDRTFWICLGVGLPLELAAFLSYMRAIKVSPLSLSVPFLAFTPAFVILTGYVFLGEVLNFFGIFGIFLIVTGSYVLNLSQMSEDWLAPFRAVFREEGSWLMLLTAFIYAFTAALGKLAIQHSSPQFFGVIYFLLFTLLLLFLFPLIPQAKWSNLIKQPWPGFAAGTVLALMIFSHTLAISLVEAAYMLSVKRTSLLFSVVLGALVFKEHKIRERLLGTLIMIVGVFIIGFLNI
jgi:drug/metabolite transporter (DMT)-like permease